MVLQVVGIRICGNQLIALREVEADSEGVGFCGSVGRHAREHLPAHLERWRSVGRPLLDVWQREPDLSHGVEGNLLFRHCQTLSDTLRLESRKARSTVHLCP